MINLRLIYFINDYIKIPQLNKHAEIVITAFEKFRKQKFLKDSTAKKLIVEEIRTPQFHILPKIYKPDIPGRLVVSSAECHTSKISKFVDHYLQPHAKALPSYMKVTSDFLCKIRETENITRDMFLVSVDVKSLYTNIPNHDGIEAVHILELEM